MERSDNLKKWDRLVARVWADEAFKRHLMDQPAEVLKEYGLEVPPGLEIRILENTDRVHYLTLPAKPIEPPADLSDRQMETVAGGWVEIKDWDEVPLGIRAKNNLGGLGR